MLRLVVCAKKYIHTLILFLIISSAIPLFFQGQKFNFHAVIPEAIEDHTWAISTAISDLTYGLNQGYMYYPEVFDALNKGGMTKYEHFLDKLENYTFPDNLKDPKLLNSALDNARKLELNTGQQAYRKRNIRPIPYSDLGLVDYYKASFRIFGFKISSPYYFFFLILLFVSLIFVFAFRHSYILLSVLPVYYYSLYVLMLFMHKANNIDYASIFNFRTLPVLLIIPVLHLLIVSFQASKLSKFQIGLLVAQSFIISFIISARNSGQWAGCALLIPVVLAFLRSLVTGGWELLKGEMNKAKASLFALMIPFALLRFIKAQKILTLFSSFGFSLIKKHSASLSDFIVSSLVVVTCLSLASYFHFIYMKKKNKSLSTNQMIIRFALLYLTVIAFPVLLFLLNEYPDHVTRNVFLFKVLKVTTALSLLYFMYTFAVGFMVKMKITKESIGQKMPSPKWISLYIFLFTLLVYKAAVGFQLHPSYSSKDVIPHHMVYHNAYMGLMKHPTIEKMLSNGRTGDSFCFLKGLEKFISEFEAKGLNYSERNYVSPYTGTYKMGLHDGYMRKLYLSFVIQHPVLTLQAHLIKLKGVKTTTFYFIKEGIRLHSKPILLLLSIFCLFLLFSSSKTWIDLENVFKALLYIALGSMVPYLYAYPPPINTPQDNQIAFFLFSVAFVFWLTRWLKEKSKLLISRLALTQERPSP